MLKKVPLFFFSLFLSSLSFAQEQEPLPPGILTVQEYAEFLQATASTDTYNLYNEKMAEDSQARCILRHGEPGSYTYEAIPERINDPVPYVSALSAKRYCNWLQNGQLSGEEDETTTEQGAYSLHGTMETDPSKEETANYFLSTSYENEIDPTLTSKQTIYMIVTHFGDSFNFEGTSSNKNQEDWTAIEAVAVVCGMAAAIGTVLHSVCTPPNNEDPYDLNNLPEQSAREEIAARQRTEQKDSDSQAHYEIAPCSSIAPALTETVAIAPISTASETVFPGKPPFVSKSQLKVITSPSELSTLSPKPNSAKSGSSKSPKKFKFTETIASIKYFDLHEDEVPPGPATPKKPQAAKTNKVVIEKTILSEDELKTIKAYQLVKQEDLKKKIVKYITTCIETANRGWDRPVAAFFKQLKTNIDFFHEKTEGMTDEEISTRRTTSPSLFQNPLLPCWNNETERQTFLGHLKENRLDDWHGIDPNVVNQVISKHTVLFEASDAIDSWKHEIQEAREDLADLNNRRTEATLTEKTRPISPQKKFATLAQTTFDHLLDFQNYIQSLTARSIPIYATTHALTPTGFAELMKNKKEINEWLTNWRDSVDENRSSPTEALPDGFQEKILILQKALNTLSLLFYHNTAEALRFLEFRHEKEEEIKKQSAITAAAQERDINSSLRPPLIKTSLDRRDDSILSSSSQGRTDSETTSQNQSPAITPPRQRNGSENQILTTGNLSGLREKFETANAATAKSKEKRFDFF